MEKKSIAHTEEKSSPPVVINSEDLFDRSRQVSIVHNGDVYCLRITANGKLILTK